MWKYVGASYFRCHIFKYDVSTLRSTLRRAACACAIPVHLGVDVWKGVSECVGGAREKASERVTEREKAE